MIFRIVHFIQSHWASKRKSQEPLVTFNDPIHGTIQLPGLLGEIINTPEFQRLHNIKQLNSTFHVYPEAQHSRFGHSIGTAHLAGKLVKHLKENQPELGINDDDVLCVQIAGLCHDLGHGPYSHLFDGQFLPLIGVKGWKHEDSSCRMFDCVAERLKEKRNKKDRGFFCEDNCEFIKEMINPSANDPRRGKNHDKEFLFQIINNKSSGVDVDKWDYFARDCHHLGIANGFDHERYIKFTRVITVPDDGKKHICVLKKEAFNLYGMFQSRFALHKRAYQHKRKNAIDHMICDALEAAHENIDIAGIKGITNCIYAGQEKAFTHLDDRILLKIEHANDDAPADMKIAKEILSRISNGDHYENVADERLRESEKSKSAKDIVEELENIDKSLSKKIRVTKAKFNYGNGEEDPISRAWFYETSKPNKPIKVKREEVSAMLPSVFQETRIQIFCTDGDLNEKAKQAVEQWKADTTPARH